MAWIAAIVFVGILSFFVVEHSERLPGEQREKLRRWYFGWGIKGCAAPAVVWILFNVGAFGRLPSLTMEVDMAPPGAARGMALAHVVGLGLFAIATYWAALTSGWLLAASYWKSDAQAEFKHRALLYSIFLVPLGLLLIWIGGWYCAGLGVAIWLMPVLQAVNSLDARPMKKPTYSRAIAQMHRDKFDDAEMAVINELENCEEDFDGWMLLAELYAVHFHDLREAERTVRETCANPTTTDSQRSVALHKLADWHLKFENDPIAARRDLEEIWQMSPNTHLARMARARFNQLPATKEEWMTQQKGKTYHLPALRNDFDLTTAETGAPATTEADALARAKRLSEKLQQNPDDAAAREELARLLAEKLGKVDAGLQQVELLLTLQGQPEQKLAEWLGLSASWQLKYKRDEPAARKILERIIRRFPQSAQAFAAQRRLNLMDLEAKIRSRGVAAISPTAEPKIGLSPS